jgi:hypothetical protein
MKTLLAVGTIVFTLSLLPNMAAQAADAQRPNPLFLEAKNLSQQLSVSALNDNAKNAWRRRFNDLEEVQKQLWDLAGQVDRGQCKENCIDLYNSRVRQWQTDLQSFIHDAKATLQALKSADPAWRENCLNNSRRIREECYKECRNGPIEKVNSCIQQCWDDNVEREKGCY